MISSELGGGWLIDVVSGWLTIKEAREGIVSICNAKYCKMQHYLITWSLRVIFGYKNRACIEINCQN